MSKSRWYLFCLYNNNKFLWLLSLSLFFCFSPKNVSRSNPEKKEVKWCNLLHYKDRNIVFVICVWICYKDRSIVFVICALIRPHLLLKLKRCDSLKTQPALYKGRFFFFFWELPLPLPLPRGDTHWPIWKQIFYF